MPTTALLGTGSSATSTVSITLTAPVPADGILQLVFVFDESGNNTESSFPGTPTDPSGNPWVIFTFVKAIMGLARVDNTTYSNWNRGDPIHSLMVGSIGRACTAGDLVAGDTITMPASAPASVIAIDAMLWYVDSTMTPVRSNSFVVYADGDGWPDNQIVRPAPGTTRNFLDFGADFGPTYPPVPDDPGTAIVAVGNLDGGGWTPISGQFAHATHGKLNVFFQSFAAGVTYEPGGVGTATSLLVSNFQLLQPGTIPPPPPGPSPKATCTRCGSGLMGLSYRIPAP